MTKIFRVVIRGHFAGLDDETRSRLLADRAEHHFLKSAFTKDGTFTYDEHLAAFNLRYEVRTGPDEAGAADEAEALVEMASLERARRWLDDAGVGHRRLRATVTDMSTMWRR